MKKQFIKRLIALCLTIIFSISIFAVECMAVAPSYNVSDSYMQGKYYNNLLSVSLTGNQIDDIINVALSQLGYHEGVDADDLSGDKTTSTTKKQKNTEYGFMHNLTNADWCAFFVSWCARQARIPASIIPKSGSCSYICDKLRSYYHDVTSGYIPVKGDLILLEPAGGVSARDASGVPAKSGHIGIVIANSDGKTIKYIEGNNGDVVRTNSCDVYTTRGNARRVQGYLHPNYDNSSTIGKGDDDIITNISDSIRVSALKATNVTSNNATLNGTCVKPSSSVIIDSCGVYFGTSKTELNTMISEKVGSGANQKNGGTGFDIWYDVNADIGRNLSAGTTYYYQFYCTYGDEVIKSSVESFTTSKAAVTTDQEALVYIYKGNTGKCYTTSTGNTSAGTLNASNGQLLCHTYSYVDLANGTRRYEYIASNGVSYWLEYNASCMGVDYLPKSITTEETHIYLNTESNTTYIPTFIQTPSNADDSIELLYGYDTDIVSVHQGQGGIFTIIANSVGTTEVTFQGYYSKKTTTITVTVVDGGSPDLDWIEPVVSDEDIYEFHTKVTDKEMARFGVQVWRSGQNEEDIEITWYDCNNFAGSYGDFEYNDPSNIGTYDLTYRINRDDLSLAGGTYLIAIYAEDAYGGVSGTTTQFYVEPSDAPLPFIDVAEGDWYYDATRYVYQNGIMTGMSANTFGPISSLSRAQFAVMLYRLEGEPEVTYSAKFPDVEAGTWYTDAVMWASENGIITGYSNGMFGAVDNIMREQMATILYRYAKAKEYDLSESASLHSFIDASAVSSFATEAMQWATGAGIITGKDNGTRLAPQENAARAECAVIFMRFMDN